MWGLRDLEVTELPDPRGQNLTRSFEMEPVSAGMSCRWRPDAKTRCAVMYTCICIYVQMCSYTYPKALRPSISRFLGPKTVM